MDEVSLAFLVGVLMGDSDGDAIYAPYKQYMEVLGKWVGRPDELIKELSAKGKIGVQRHGAGYRVALMDAEEVGRVRAMLSPPKREDAVKAIDDAIKQASNPITGYADIGQVIKLVAGRLGISQGDAEAILVKSMLGSKSYILAYGGTHKIKIGSSYYGLVKKVN